MLAAQLDTGFAVRHAAELQPPRRPAPRLALAAAALEALLPARRRLPIPGIAATAGGCRVPGRGWWCWRMATPPIGCA